MKSEPKMKMTVHRLFLLFTSILAATIYNTIQRPCPVGKKNTFYIRRNNSFSVASTWFNRQKQSSSVHTGYCAGKKTILNQSTYHDVFWREKTTRKDRCFCTVMYYPNGHTCMDYTVDFAWDPWRWINLYLKVYLFEYIKYSLNRKE